MDKLSISGLIIAVLAIYLGFIIEGGSIGALFEFPAFIIVFGGTVGAVMLQSSHTQFFHAMTLLKWVLFSPQYNVEQGIESIVMWAGKARELGFLSLEGIAEKEEDIFIKKGLNFIVDGVEVERLRIALELDLELYHQHNMRSAHVFESMGGYSPTVGILGAVLGLIHAMSNLSDPLLLGQGIATAFVATIYGVGFANLIYLPVANKIKAIVNHQTMYREMMVEGLISIALAENPHAIENKLSAFRLEQ